MVLTEKIGADACALWRCGAVTEGGMHPRIRGGLCESLGGGARRIPGRRVVLGACAHDDLQRLFAKNNKSTRLRGANAAGARQPERRSRAAVHGRFTPISKQGGACGTAENVGTPEILCRLRFGK